MSNEYLYETYSSDTAGFDSSFTEYLNGKGRDNWKVKHCTYCHDAVAGKTWASCIFKR